MFLEKLKTYGIYLTRYGMIGVTGIAVDYSIFFLLMYLTGLQEAYANGISLIIAFTLTWIAAGKTMFRSYNISWLKYCLWFAYIGTAIFLYSCLLEIMISASINVVLCKIIITALSFLVNSTFFKYCILFSKITV